MDNLEKKNLVRILSEFSNESMIDERIGQLGGSLDSVSDKWVQFVPSLFISRWEALPIETKCIVQGFCIRIADLQSEIDDQ